MYYPGMRRILFLLFKHVSALSRAIVTWRLRRRLRPARPLVPLAPLYAVLILSACASSPTPTPHLSLPLALQAPCRQPPPPADSTAIALGQSLIDAWDAWGACARLHAATVQAATVDKAAP